MNAPSADFLDGRVTLHSGDCREVIRSLPDNSIDSVVTDPPYALVSIVKRFANSPRSEATENTENPYGRTGRGFMGQRWDNGETAFAAEFWAEVLRVLKPGGHVVSFSGTRTYHRMAVAIEDAGFEIRDQIGWLYGSGFPKSHDVSKGIDRVRDREKRDAVCEEIKRARAGLGLTTAQVGKLVLSASEGVYGEWYHRAGAFFYENGMLPSRAEWPFLRDTLRIEHSFDAAFEDAERAVIGTRDVIAGVAFTSVGPTTLDVTAPASISSLKWQGWGTALKPAWEPICLARKPLAGTVAANVLEHGTGALNIGGCRIGDFVNDTPPGTDRYNAANHEHGYRPNAYGREGEASADRRYTDKGSTNFAATPGPRGGSPAGRWPANIAHDGSDEVLAAFPDTGASKASAGRNGNDVGDVFSLKRSADDIRGHDDDGGSAARFFYTAKADSEDRLGSKHPTVKPLDLMQYLCRLVTPPGGTVLDCFAGTGTTGETGCRGNTAVR